MLSTDMSFQAPKTHIAMRHILIRCSFSYIIYKHVISIECTLTIRQTFFFSIAAQQPIG